MEGAVKGDQELFRPGESGEKENGGDSDADLQKPINA